MNARIVLEIGSGTGQHAVYFAEHMPWLTWQCSDVAENLAGIQQWIDDANLNNLLTPIELDVSAPGIEQQYDAVYSSNSLHIMSEDRVIDFFKLVAEVTSAGADMIIYGPFNYGGRYTSDSNAEFDRRLNSQDPESGIRDFEWINELAGDAGFVLVSDHAMPANNHCLHWLRTD